MKSVREAIRSIQIEENAEKKKMFPVFNEIKNGDPPKEREAKEMSASRVYTQHASEDEGVVRGEVGAVSPGSGTIN